MVFLKGEPGQLRERIRGGAQGEKGGAQSHGRTVWEMNGSQKMEKVCS